MPLYIRAAAELLGRDVVGRPLPVGQGRRGAARRCCARTCATPARWRASPAHDYVEPELFEQLLDEAGERAAEFSGRMKVGDVLHDPPDGECPPWCRWHGVCRVANP